MVTKLLTKVSVSGGALIGSMFGFNPSIMNDKGIEKTPKEPSFKIEVEQIKKIEDIDIFAKQRGCSFQFVNSWGTEKKVNNAKNFITEAIKQERHNTTEEDYWTRLMIEAIQRVKEKCEKNKVLVFFNRGNSNSLDLTGPQ